MLKMKEDEDAMDSEGDGSGEEDNLVKEETKDTPEALLLQFFLESFRRHAQQDESKDSDDSEELAFQQFSNLFNVAADISDSSSSDHKNSDESNSNTKDSKS